VAQVVEHLISKYKTPSSTKKSTTKKHLTHNIYTYLWDYSTVTWCMYAMFNDQIKVIIMNISNICHNYVLGTLESI
jgi:hypothetical protein